METMPFFSTSERLRTLEKAAQMWVGTPFRDNSCVCKAGASCVGACAGVLWQAGFDFPQYPPGRTDWARHQAASVMERWLDERSEYFQPVLADCDQLTAILQPGDVVGFQAGNCLHHLGIILEHKRFFQCNESLGAVILSQAEPMFKKRLARAWRPVKGIIPI